MRAEAIVCVLLVGTCGCDDAWPAKAGIDTQDGTVAARDASVSRDAVMVSRDSDLPDGALTVLPDGSIELPDLGPDMAPPCDPSPEICNEVDDDCDGRVDEFFSLGAPCGVGLGACRVLSEIECNDVGEAICPAESADNTQETCDGIDNDCDGRTDEGYVGGATTCGEGNCAGVGERICEGGQVIDTCSAFPPGFLDPNCDDIDEDCDTFVDEDFLPRVETCGVGVCARQIVSECVEGMELGACIPGEPLGDDSECNGLDDDCDGDTDEACAFFSDGGMDDDGGFDPDMGEVAGDGGVDGAVIEADGELPDVARILPDACLGDDCGAPPIDQGSRVLDDGCGCHVGANSRSGGSSFAYLLGAFALLIGLRRRW